MIEKTLGLGETADIYGNDAHHIIDVLRLRPGDWLVLSDGKGSRFRCEISGLDKKSVAVQIKEKLPDLRVTNITLAQAVTKHDKFETIIQKAVELGVPKIIPFSSTRTVPRLTKDTSEKKIARWNKIALEASKQCGLPIKPEVMPIIDFNHLIESAESYEHRLIFYEGEKKTTLRNYFEAASPAAPREEKTLLMIGPEGGFASHEVELARMNGFTTLRLGPLIMRVETAAISAITLTQFFLGHFD